LENFLNSSARALKTGMQNVANEFGVNLGLLFKKRGAFDEPFRIRQFFPIAVPDPVVAVACRFQGSLQHRVADSGCLRPGEAKRFADF